MSEIAPYQQIGIIFTASLLYGLYISTLLVCYRWLLLPDPDPHTPAYSPQKSWVPSWIPRRRNVVCWPMVTATTWIFALTLVYLVTTFMSAAQAVQRASGGGGEGQEQGSRLWIVQVRFPDSTALVLVTDYKIWKSQCAAANFVALLADGVLTFRLYVVYTDQLLVMVIPILLWLGGIVCTAIQIWLQVTEIANITVAATSSTPASWLGSTPSYVNVSLGPGMVLTPFWGAMVVLNAYCTFMLIYKVARASKEARYDEASTAEFHFIIRIVAESGILFLSATIALFVVWFTTDNLAVMVVTAFNVPMMGIAFNMMLIRAYSNKSRQNWSQLYATHDRPNTQNPGSLSEPYSSHLNKPRLTSDLSIDSAASRFDPSNNDDPTRRAEGRMGGGIDIDTPREWEMGVSGNSVSAVEASTSPPSRLKTGSESGCDEAMRGLVR